MRCILTQGGGTKCTPVVPFRLGMQLDNTVSNGSCQSTHEGIGEWSIAMRKFNQHMNVNFSHLEEYPLQGEKKLRNSYADYNNKMMSVEGCRTITYLETPMSKIGVAM